MNRVLLVFSFLTIVVLSAAAQPGKYTLEQCIETALRNNIQVRQSGLQVQAAEVAYRQSKANLLPDLNGSVTHGINQGRSIDPFTNTYIDQKVNYASYAIGSGLVLFNGLSQQNNIRQNSLAYEASQLEEQQVKDNLTLNVILAYLQVLSNEDLVTQSAQQVLVTQKQVERLEVLNKQGAIGPPQLHELRGQLKEDELLVVNNRNALANSRLALAQLMQVPYDTAMRVERISMEDLLYKYSGTANEVYNNAVNHLAMVKAAELRRRSAAAGIKAVRGEAFPTVLLSGNLNSNYSSAASRDILLNSTEAPTADYIVINGSKVPVITRQNNYASEKITYGSQIRNNLFSNVGLTLRIPLLNAFQTRNRVKLATIELKNVELIQENTQVQLRQQIEQAHLNMTNAWERYKILVEGVEAYTEAFRAAEIRFNAGLGTSVDYLIAKNNLDRASLNLVMARYEYLLRKRVLDFYAGTLIVK
jgi:outer membrane protein